MTAHFKDTGPPQSIKITELESAGYALKPCIYRAFGKRTLDVFIVIAGAPVGVMLIAFAALLAVLGGQSPFYVQPRVGKDGKIFRMLKIRTMVADADTVLEDYLAQHPSARKEWDEKQKLKDDPRISRFGAFLRKTSLDEMPQLWNVLKGDMSIVGPRPMMVNQQSLYPGKAYYMLRPGITGPWQVSDRHHSSFSSRAIFDAEYNQGLSLKNDLRILARTVEVVLRCTGC
jgi:lipopolysaccharide/colanic/teichoic acid biosynthesis glycosyltransferase